MELTASEIRVLGCLVEKEATTPDNYPLSTNALTAACNQSTSRDPVVHYRESEVDAVMLALRDQGLARTVRGDGQRVHKHKHVLAEAWHLDRAELAVLSVLMLRGAQTAAELRARTERYGPGLELAAVEALLVRLAERGEPFVARVPRRPGEREGRWTHLLGDVADGSTSAAEVGAHDVRRDDDGSRPAPAPSTAFAPVSAARASATDALEARVAALEHTLAGVVARLDALALELGIDP